MKPKNNRTGILCLTIAFAASSAWAATITVGPSGDHATLAAAVTAAAPDDTIQIEAGTFVLADKITINKKLHIKGAGKSQTILIGAGSPFDTEEPLIFVDSLPTHNGNNPNASFDPGIALSSGTTVEDLTLGGWQNAGNAQGYLLWTGAVRNVEVKNVAFTSNTNRCGFYADNCNDLILQDCDFTGDFYTWAYRGSGRRLTIKDNNFDVVKTVGGGILSFEYSRSTSAVIEGNSFRHTVSGPNYLSAVNGHRTIASVNPLDSTDPTPGLVIKDNTFQFIVANANSLGKYPIPVAIQNKRASYTLSQDPGAPTSITGNTFTGYDYLGTDVVKPAIIETHLNSVVTGNAFTPHAKSSVILTGTGSPLLNATGNFWGSAAGPSATDTTGSVDTGSFVTTVPPTITGPVSIVGRTQTYLTIQAAVTDAVANDTIKAAPGIYQEAVNLNLSGLKLLSTGGRAVTKIITPTIHGSISAPVVVAGGANNVEVGAIGQGFEIVGFEGNSPGNESAALYFQGAHAGAKVIGNKIVAAGDCAFLTEYGLVNSDFIVSNNEFAGKTFTGTTPGGVYGDNQFSTPNYPRILVAVNGNQVSNFQFTDNDITGTAGGLDSGGLAHGQILVYFDDAMAGLEIKRNNFGGITNGGVLPGQTPRSALIVDGTGIEIENNVFNANAPAGLTTYSTISSLVGNSFSSSPGRIISNKSGVNLDASHNYWGSVSGPTAFLPKLVGPISFSPWYSVSNGLAAPNLAVSVLRSTVAPDNIDDVTISTPVTTPDLYIAPTQTVTVTPTGSLTAGKLELSAGAEIIVNEGALAIGDGSVISGTFTVFNSFGSWNINGDTTFNIGQSLALISDIHVAGGKTLTVNGGGELVLDGCVIDSQTSGTKYNITAATDGVLTMARNVVKDANISINTVNGSVPPNVFSRVYDNSFTNSAIAASDDAKVYHNVLTSTPVGAGAAFAAVDGWGNVTSVASLQNKFVLDFDAPVAIGRTLDSGNLFVQTGDVVAMRMDVSSLGTNGITAAEALLGYNSTMLTPTGAPIKVGPLGNWQIIKETSSITPPSTIGMVDSALGLQLAAGAPGSSADETIAKVNFTAANAGVTLGFFRVQTNRVFNPDGSYMKDTRLTKEVAGLPSYLTAFTANTGELVIDNLAPEILAIPAITGTQVQPSQVLPVNVQNSANPVFRTANPVVLTFSATDNGHGLSGLDAVDHPNDLVLKDVGTNSVIPQLYYTVGTAEVSGVVTYTVSLSIPANQPSGTYTVSGTVQDRSGNVSAVTTLGSYTLVDEAQVNVELQGFVGTTRDVTFVATGGVTATWTKTITNFVGGTGFAILEYVPVGTTSISAKTAWTLRNKVATASPSAGVYTANLTGASKLNAGDITGDNVINTLDYSVLRFNWLTASPVSDMSGEGVTNTTDYTLLQTNFYTVGTPQ